MAATEKDREQGIVTYGRYTPEHEETLSDAVLATLQRHKGTDLSQSDFFLYDAINPDALNNLIRYDDPGSTDVAFDIADLRVEIHGSSTVTIEVSGQAGHQ